MAGSIFTSFGAGDANATAFMTHLIAMTKGYNALSLTNMSNTTVPAIAAGSVIEDNGALFKFDAEEAISIIDPHTSSTVADGTIYVMLIPSGNSITAAFTATAPTWSDSKQGWYGASTYANNKYLPIKITKSSSSYTKYVLFSDQILTSGISPSNGATTYSGEVSYSGDVTFGGAASFGDESVAGFFVDGTPYYIKLVSISMPSTSYAASVSHGISNAKTNDRIKMVNAHPLTSHSVTTSATVPWACSLEPAYIISYDNMTSAYNAGGIRSIAWNDSSIGISRYYSSSLAQTYIVAILYI